MHKISSLRKRAAQQSSVTTSEKQSRAYFWASGASKYTKSYKEWKKYSKQDTHINKKSPNLNRSSPLLPDYNQTPQILVKMERKNFLQHRENPRRSQSYQVKGNAHASASRRSPGDRNSNCGNQAAEFACSACVCCVSCPISIVWCCVKLPCKIGWRAVKNAVDWTCSCGSGKQDFVEYSSFSDIDSDRLPRRTNSSSDLIGSKGRIALRGNGWRCNTNRL